MFCVEGRVTKLYIAPDQTCTTRVHLVDNKQRSHELRLYNHQYVIDIAKQRGIYAQRPGIYDRREWERLVTELAEAFKADKPVCVDLVDGVVIRVSHADSHTLAR